ncbi:hypothetical protein FB107DRAFT_273025 [Schizophyllum commune]
MSRPTRRLNELAAIDKLTLARHVADFPKTRQTRPTSPSTPRPTTGPSSQWADAEGSGLACRAVLVAAEVLSQAIYDASACAKNRILTRNAPRPAREFLVEGRDTGRGGRGEGGGAERRRQRARAKIPQIVGNCAEVRALNPR